MDEYENPTMKSLNDDELSIIFENRDLYTQEAIENHIRKFWMYRSNQLYRMVKIFAEGAEFYVMPDEVDSWLDNWEGVEILGEEMLTGIEIGNMSLVDL